MPDRDSPKNLVVSGLAMLTLAAIIIVSLFWLIPGAFAFFESDPGHNRHHDPTHRFAGLWVSFDFFLIAAAYLLGRMGVKSLYWSIRGEPDDFD